jgi:hypothetical protein
VLTIHTEPACVTEQAPIEPVSELLSTAANVQLEGDAATVPS